MFPDADNGGILSLQVTGAAELDLQTIILLVVDDTVVVACHGDGNIVHVQRVGTRGVIHRAARDVVAHDVITVVAGNRYPGY